MFFRCTLEDNDIVLLKYTIDGKLVWERYWIGAKDDQVIALNQIAFDQLKIEKELNGDLKYTTDWTYIKYKRDKDPYNDPSSPWPPNSLNTSCWTWENEVEYEIIRDLKLKIGLDYRNGLGFSAFDNLTSRIELQLRKPGLIDFRIGYRYIDYFNIDEGVDTVFFKLGWFI